MKLFKISEKSDMKQNDFNNLELLKDTDLTGCTLKDLNEALDDIGIGNLKSEKAMSEKEKVQIAYHEAGHTLVSCLIGGGSVPLKVSIIPRGHSLGFTQPLADDKCLMFRKELVASICITLGGRGAEQIKFDDITTGASDDLTRVTEMANKFFKDYCFGNRMNLTVSKLYSDNYSSRLNRAADKLINNCFKLVCRMLTDHVDLLNNLATRLIDRETLYSNDLLDIVPKDLIQSIEVDVDTLI
jgi:cell division protease FtsH